MGGRGSGSRVRRTPEQFAADFWAKVEKTSTCWLWKGARSRKGYGVVSMEGWSRRAHRVSFFLEHGRWPADGLLVLHQCDTPACVRPSHLREGTHLDNSFDEGDRREAGGAPGARTPWYLRHLRGKASA